MRFLVISGIGFLVIGIVFGVMNYYLRVDREASRRMADQALREFCQPHKLSYTVDHLGVADGSRNKYSWRVEVAFLTPEDQAIESPELGRMVLRRNLPLRKSILFDFTRGDKLILHGFRGE